ncbi:hypothetical protein VEE60_31640 [Escherichia coli]|nr:hypothetical protein VEE60_31640 [Escherichia coli]
MIFTSSCCDNLSIDEIIERAEKGDCEAQYIVGFYYNRDSAIDSPGDDSNLLIVFYVQIMPDDFVMQLHRF